MTTGKSEYQYVKCANLPVDMSEEQAQWSIIKLRNKAVSAQINSDGNFGEIGADDDNGNKNLVIGLALGGGTLILIVGLGFLLRRGTFTKSSPSTS